MSNKARSLRKRLKEKEEQEKKQEKPEVTNIKTSKLSGQLQLDSKKKQQEQPLSSQAPVKRRDSYIDPLEYFQKEHIVKDENNILDEIFGDEKEEFEENDGKKEENKDQKPKPKPKGGMMMGMPMPMGMPGMGFKINFEEMMKARSKIKKEPVQEKKPERPASVKNRPVQKKIEIDEEDNDAEPQIKAGNEQNLYIKLIMARNKYNELSSAKANVYKKILDQIQTIRQIKDFPPKYIEKLDEYESKLKVPERLILDPDVQEIDKDKKYVKIVKNPLSLDNIINSLK